MRRDIVAARRGCLLGSLVMAVVTALAGCVEVPDSIRAHFAAPQPGERSNFRPGPHGTAPPNDDAPPTPRESRPVAADGGFAPTLDGGMPPGDAGVIPITTAGGVS